MDLLLDTHIWLWSTLQPKRLSHRVASALAKPTNHLWLSHLSIAEVVNLSRSGRLNLRPTPAEWVESALETMPVTEATVTHDVALAVREIGLPHRDPIDLLLAASAKVYGLTLVTADEALLSGSGFTCLANR